MRNARLLLLLLLSPSAILVYAQVPAQELEMGWTPLPDSLFVIWKLEDDQVRRLRVIETDYGAERVAVLSNKRIGESQRMAELRALANARREDIRAVLRAAQYMDWEQRFPPGGTR